MGKGDLNSIGPAFFDPDNDEGVFRAIVERCNRQTWSRCAGGDPLCPGSNKPIELLGRVITLLGRIDMVAVTDQPIKGQSRTMLVIVIIGIQKSAALAPSSLHRARFGYGIPACNFAFFNSSFLREPDFPICLELGSHAGPF